MLLYSFFQLPTLTVTVRARMEAELQCLGSLCEHHGDDFLLPIR